MNSTNRLTRLGASKASRLDGELLLVLGISLLFTLPIWISASPPMVDYPQHLSIASILRWYHDPSRHLAETYTLALTRPNTAFAFLVSLLSYLLPLGVAGKLVVAGSVGATGLAGLALARRAGRPGWFGLLALISSYNFAFFFGFVNNVIATPLFLYGIVLADRQLDRRFSLHAWLLLAIYGCAFYFVHLQFLFLFAGTVGWLALARRRDWRSLLLVSSSQIASITMALVYYFLCNPETFGYHERKIYRDAHEPVLVFDKLIGIPEYVFGAFPEGRNWLLFCMALLAIVLAIRARLPAPEQTDASPRQRGRWAEIGEFLTRTRFVALAVFFCAAFLLMPHVFVGIFVYQRIIAVAWLMLPAVLPPPEPSRIRPSQLVLAGTLALQILMNAEAACVFHSESRGGHALIAKTRPGKSLMALMLDMDSSGILSPPLFLHFGSHYLASKGGRIFFSFSELYISPVHLRPELAFEDQDAIMNEWQPYFFNFNGFGYHYDYVLCHGGLDHLHRIFGHHLANLAWEVDEDWILLWRKSQADLATVGVAKDGGNGPRRPLD